VCGATLVLILSSCLYQTQTGGHRFIVEVELYIKANVDIRKYAYHCVQEIQNTSYNLPVPVAVVFVDDPDDDDDEDVHCCRVQPVLAVAVAHR